MAEHSNVEVVRRGYDAFSKGDFAALGDVFADDVVWHVAGPGPLAGDYEGRDAVYGLFAELMKQTDGNFRLDVHDVLANDDHAVALVTASGTRGGKSLESQNAHVFHMRDGRVSEYWAATTDPESELAFWS
ncbi:MAG: nuclear transport factor 2 family protein [Acidimicrobiales bacterium]